MPDERPLTILCVTSYEKGQEFIRPCKAQGCRVLLLTVEKLKDADWPREFLDGILCGYHGHDIQVRAIGRHTVYQNLALPSLASADLEISRSKGIGAHRIAGG